MACARMASVVMSCSRRPSTCRMCQPNWVRTGSDITHGGCLHGLFEFRHHLAGIGPAQLAALLGGADILGVLPGKLAKILPGLHPGFELDREFPGLLVGHDFRGLDQDMADLGLRHDFIATAFVLQKYQVKAAVAADRPRGLALIEGWRHVGEERGKIVSLAPAQVTATERVLAGASLDGLLEGLAGANLCCHLVHVGLRRSHVLLTGIG